MGKPYCFQGFSLFRGQLNAPCGRRGRKIASFVIKQQRIPGNDITAMLKFQAVFF